MSASALPFEVPRPVARKVSRLRTLVRLYSLAEGTAALAIVAGTAFWIGLAIDWLLEPRPAFRVAMWAVVAAAAAYVFWKYIGRRILAPLPDDSLALLVERQYPQLGEMLVTTVQARADADLRDQPFGRKLIDATSRQASDAVRNLRLRRVFDLRPLGRKAAIGALLAASVAVFALANREAMAFWRERIMLSEQLWPRRVALSVVGFDRGADSPAVNVARDDDYELTVLASLADGHEAPGEVEIRWRRPSDGGRGGGTMLRIGDARPGDQTQEYRYTFKVGSDLEFDVIGGDDRIRNLRLRAVERPAVTRVRLDVQYPKYMERASRTIAVSGRAELPEGARAVCRIEANKPLESVVVRNAAEQTDIPASISPRAPQEFTFAIEPSSADRVLAISLHDADGVENREPFRLPVSIIPDEPPEVSVQLRGIGTAVTPQATIPFTGRVTDDYALVEAAFEYQIDEQPAERRPLRVQPEGLLELRMSEAFDLAETAPGGRVPLVALKPGQRLSLNVKARDAYDLSEAPHEGSSQRFQLDVVTASELRALLEKRELGLRQRFEAVYDKMVGVRELLDRIDLAAKAPDADDGSGGETASADTPAGVAQADSARTANRLAERDLSRVIGARQSGTEIAFETRGVAEGFDDIVAELINNRVDTEELKQRLEQGIAEPLKAISGEQLPKFAQRLQTLQTAIEADRQAATAPLTAAKLEADAVAEAMKAVLDRMLELESYNELVELLRGIVEEQDQLKGKTQEQQREKLRELLQ
jgi:hypothetical protein